MTTFVALAAIIAACVLLGIFFAPRYGTYRCCCGQALQSVEKEYAAKHGRDG